MKKKFLITQAIVNSISAAFQHAGVYKPSLGYNDVRRNDLRTALSEELRRLGKIYTKLVDEKTHCRNIVGIANTLTRQFEKADMLRDDRFRIGVAQKALNLYLKYLWCLGDIPTPPHCPIDRGIIGEIDMGRQEIGCRNWTKIDDIDLYKTLIQACKAEAKSISIAEWELKKFRT